MIRISLLLKPALFALCFPVVFCADSFCIFAQPVNMMKPPKTDSSQILAQQIVGSTVPVLVDFWAPWCRPCHMLTPVISELKKDYSGRINVMKINVDENRRIANHFRVSSIPAVFIIKDRAVVKSILGVQDKSAYVDAIEEVLAGNADSPSSSQKAQNNNESADQTEK
jgi:thioredoxin 1